MFHGPQKTLSLITSYHLMVKEIRSKKRSREEKDFLIKIINKLEDILNQRYWFQSSSDFAIDARDEKYVTPDKKSLTQSKVLSHARERHLLSLNQTYIELLLIQQKIINKTDFLYKNLAANIEAVLTELRKGRTAARTSRLVLSEKEQKLYSGNIVFQLASQLEARYFPHMQSQDPLARDSGKGICYGDTRQWIEEIKKQGRSISPARGDDKTIYYQKEQQYLRCINDSVVYYYDFKSDIWEMINAITKKINCHYLYQLECFSNDGILNHSLGIRKIPWTGEIEFRDSNLATFVFKNEKTFHTFFYAYFTNQYSSYSGGEINLAKVAKQPVYARPSLPKVINDIPLGSSLSANVSARSYSVNQIMAALVLQKEKDDKKLSDELDKTIRKQHKTFTKEYHDSLKCRTASVIQEEINRLLLDPIKNLANIYDLNRLKQKILAASLSLTLISVVDDWLDEKPPTPFIKTLVKNQEISPISLLILQKELILEIAETVNKNWSHLMPIWGDSVKINKIALPRSVSHLRELLASYYLYDQKDSALLLESIRFRAKARLWNWRNNETEEFFTILKEIDVNNPQSLFAAVSKLKKFEKRYLEEVWKARALLAFKWLASLFSCAISAYGGLILGAAIGTGICPILGTIIGAFIGFVISNVVERVVMNSPWHGQFGTQGHAVSPSVIEESMSSPKIEENPPEVGIKNSPLPLKTQSVANNRYSSFHKIGSQPQSENSSLTPAQNRGMTITRN